ncbi:MAG: tRNA (N(6)-L-threonylcarbamoyladenosine(37)-C(2))-methylthiotransferase MtaB, partial [Holosporales bacterium]|nr:tRNA (N(6)-L-threonylcarbamoyladenosine(37)-C(2))-methylthiotransferase MtaB [Holosporales bacterium]
LSALIRYILEEVPDLPQLRLSSLDPASIDEDFIDTFATEQRLMPYAHLSIQSSSSAVLKAMRRRHSQEDLVALCQRLRMKRPDIALGADLIAGFPTEREEDFREMLHTLPTLGLTFLHVFPYSKRPGTLAASMPDLPRSVVLDRARQLRFLKDQFLQQSLRQYVGQTITVVVERPNSGKTPQFIPVTWDRPSSPRTRLSMRIIGTHKNALIAAYS